MNLISINNEDYISLNDAENYLDEPSAIFRVEVVFFKYKGFAEMRGYPDQIMRDTSETDPDMVEWIDVTPSEEVYVDGMAEIVIQPLIQAYYDAADVYISEFQEFIGLVNGKQSNVSYFENNKAIHIRQQLLNLYDGSNYNDDFLIRVADLDALADKYGIPKKIESTINSEVTPTAENKAPIRKILTIKEPDNNNERYKAMKKCIDVFVHKNGFTPSFDELYPILVDTKHSNDEVFTWDSRCKQGVKDRYKVSAY